MVGPLEPLRLGVDATARLQRLLAIYALDVMQDK